MRRDDRTGYDNQRARCYEMLRRQILATSYAWAPIIAATILFAANAGFQTSFLSPDNWASTLAVLAPFAIGSMAQAFPVISGDGGLDLSIGPLMGFITVLVAAVFVPHGISSPEFLLPLILFIGFIAGIVNGWLVAYVRLPAIIATLGAYLFYTGISLYLLPSPGGEMPSWVTNLATSYGPIPAMLVVFAVIAVLWMFLMRTAYRRNLFAVGGDSRVAYASGVAVAAVRCCAYGFGGLLAAVGGLTLAATLNGGDATVGASYTITSIAAVALGGVALAGGRGGLLGAATGGVIMFLIQNLLTLASVSVFALNIANGVILLGALALNSLVVAIRRRRHLAAGGTHTWKGARA